MHTRRRTPILAAFLSLTVLAVGFSAGAGSAVTPKRGGELRIARIEDSQSFDKTNVFQNESIWLTQQLMEQLYTVGRDGRTLKPWLATSHSVSNGGKRYTFRLREGVRFSNGQPMTAADVKFSIDDARAPSRGWSFLDIAIKNVQVRDPQTVVINLKYRWAPFLADIALFSNAIIPKDFAGQKRAEFYKHPIGTGPFMWDKRVVGQSVTFKRNPYYWQKGKPYLDSVTWTYVSDQNTRELQLRGGQIEIDEFPPFNSIKKLNNTPGITMRLFPSTRTDYLLMNESYAPLKDRNVRRAISYAIDRKSIVRSVLFGFGQPANSFMPPQVPFYDPKAPGIQYSMAKARAELAKSGFPDGFKVDLQVGAGEQVENAIGQILQQSLKKLGITVTFKQVDTSTAFANIQEGKYQLGFSYWTMDIADPDELVTFAVDPKGGGANSFFTGYNNPAIVKLSQRAQREVSVSKRRALYKQIQRIAAEDAFMGFLYYSPFRYAYSKKVHGFFVYPLGNYHLEDVWLD
ncbi:MAG TPA: ABC transporter substrate-binding protein [Gaiellaceae bacterium]|nr:ABC transporter substrate-binding protein [Gaiellaceae bacterium]